MRVGLVALCALTWWGCPEDRKVVTSCSSDSQCPSGFCFDQCLEPDGDVDADGLSNSVEREWGSDLFDPDTDGDGKGDQEEYGTFPVSGAAPPDADGDGLYDFEESATDDDDDDCLADELDNANASPDVFVAYAETTCGVLDTGVCAGRLGDINFQCTASGTELVLDAPACTFDELPGYAAEDGCDAIDNDCDGETDEDCAPTTVCGDLAPQDAAQTIFVAKRGTDVGDGTAQSPYPTLSAALNAGNTDGKTIVVGAGIYDDAASITEGTVTIVGGYEECDFAGPGDPSVQRGPDGSPALNIGGSAIVTLSSLVLEAPSVALQVAGVASVTADALVVEASAGTAVEVWGGQLSLINAVVNATSAAPSATTHMSAVWMHGGGRLTAFNSLLRVQGDGDPLAAVYAEDAANTFLVNTLLGVGAGTALTQAGVVSLVASAQPVLHHCDLTLPAGIPPVLHAGTPYSIALLGTIGGVANLALGCAPTAAPWQLAQDSPCIDRGADPTQPPYGIGYAPHMLDRQGEPRRADPEGGNGFWDIGPDEVAARTCTGAAECASQRAEACLAEVCTASGLCANPLDGGNSDMDGDGTCDALDLDTDGDGVQIGTDCDDTDWTVGAGVDADADGVCDAIDACPTSGPGTVDADYDGCFDLEDCDDTDPTSGVDSDFDGRCDDVDQCPNGVDGSSGEDEDLDGCWTPREDCDDTSATTFAGAPEVCDGVDNDCSHGGIDFAPDTGVLYVQQGQGGDGLTPTSPLGAINDALALADADPSISHVLVAPGTYDEPILFSNTALTNIDVLTIQGSADPGCAWEPTGAPSTLVRNEPRVLDIESTATSLTFRDLRLEPLTAGLSDYEVVYFRNGDVGTRVFDHVEVQTPAAAVGAGSVTTGFWVVGNGVELNLSNVDVTLGAAGTVTGVFVNQSAQVGADRIRVELDGTAAAGSVRGLDLGATGTDIITNSLVLATGDTGFSNWAINKSQGGDLVVGNTVVQGFAGSVPVGVRYVSDTGSLLAYGCSVTVGAGGDALIVQSSLPGAQSAVIGSIANGPNRSLYVGMANGATLLLAHNAFFTEGPAAVSGPGGGAATSGEINSCGWPGCDPATGLNIVAQCPLDPNFQLPAGSPCVGFGGDPADFGLFLPFIEVDRDGDPRPGPNGTWDIGPDEAN